MFLFSSSNIIQLPPSKSDLWILTQTLLRRIISTAHPLFRDHSMSVKNYLCFFFCASNTNTDTRKFSVLISCFKVYHLRCMNDKPSAAQNDFSSEICWFRAVLLQSFFKCVHSPSCQQSLICISHWQVQLEIIFHYHPTAVLQQIRPAVLFDLIVPNRNIWNYFLVFWKS